MTLLVRVHHPVLTVFYIVTGAIASQDKWGFRMTARYDMYKDLLQKYDSPNFSPQVIRDTLV